MNGVNLVVLLGNVGADPEVKELQSGMVANFRLATSKSYKDKETGERKDATEWHSVTAWGPLASVVQRFVKKGTKLYVQGSLRTRKWTDREGRDRYSTEVVAETLNLVGDKPAEAQPGHGAN